MGTAAGVTNFCGLHANVHGEIRQVVHGVADDLLARIDRLGGLNEPHLIFGQDQRAGLRHRRLQDRRRRSARVAPGRDAVPCARPPASSWLARASTPCLFETKSGRSAVARTLFIDCSGDGDLAAFAGAPFENGDDDGGMLYPIDDVPAERRRSAARRRGHGSNPGHDGRCEAERGVQLRAQGRDRPAAETPRPNGGPTSPSSKTPTARAVDGTDVRQLTCGEIEGRRQVAEYFDFLRSRVPGFEHAYIVDTAPQLGIRETRRSSAGTVLSADDVLNCVDFDDTIGVNGWPLEMHVAGDVRWVWPDIPTARGFNHLPTA